MNPRVLLLALGTFALGTNTFVVAGVLHTIAQKFGVTDDTAGLLVSVFAFTYAISAPISATVTASIPRRSLLIGVLVVFCFANLFSALAPNFALLVVSRALAALCAAIYTPTASAVAVSLSSPEKRGQALATITGGLTVATLLGVPLGTFIGVNLGWQMAFVLVVVLGLLAVAGLWFSLPDVDSPPPVSLAVRLSLLKQWSVVSGLSITLLVTLGAFVLYTYISSYLQKVTLISANDVGFMLLLYGGASVVGNFLGGYLADHYGPTRSLGIALVVAIVIMAVFNVLAGSVVGAAFAMIVWGAVGWCFNPIILSRLIAVTAKQPGVVIALNSSAIYFGIALGSTVGGFTLSLTASYPALALVGAAIEGVALLVWVIATLSDRPKVAESEAVPVGE